MFITQDWTPDVDATLTSHEPTAHVARTSDVLAQTIVQTVAMTVSMPTCASTIFEVTEEKFRILSHIYANGFVNKSVLGNINSNKPPNIFCIMLHVFVKMNCTFIRESISTSKALLEQYYYIYLNMGTLKYITNR